MRPGMVAVLVLAGLLLVLLVPVLFLVTLPTTFACRAVIDASAEAKLAYPNSRQLSYRSTEGSRQLIEMSSPQLPGFIEDLAISPDDREAFRWFEEQLVALGWRPLNPEARLQVLQSSGETTRGSAEAIYIIRFEADRVPPGIGVTPPAGQALLRYSYVVRDPAALQGCR